MTFDRNFFTSATGQVLLVGAVLFLGVVAVRWQHRGSPALPLPAPKPAPAVPLPKTLTREVTKFTRPSAAGATVPPGPAVTPPPAPSVPRPCPLALFVAPRETLAAPPGPMAPYGRLIPCETVVALESNRLDTPIIGLVTEDVWHDGRLIIPAGTEVHGKAALDRARERLAAQGSWHIVWRTPDPNNGTELVAEGLALDREWNAVTGRWGEHDGSAGLRGQVLKTADDRELKLFAATFLATATAALQDVRASTGLLGETALPAATVRNASLAGTGAVLREYAQGIRDSITRDGFYLRVPAGKAFYLYITQTLDRSQGRPTPVAAPPQP
jgi:hypothetical protein